MRMREHEEPGQVAHDGQDATRTVATRVVPGPAAPLSGEAVDVLQRAAGNAAVVQLLEEQRVQVPSSGGTPLDTGLRHFMEARLGADFSSVRVHTGPTAAESATALQAKAYTAGEHIVFGSDAYRPDTAAGRRTIAHELVHVVQQRTEPVDGTPIGGGLALSSPDDRFERAAEATAAEVLTADEHDNDA